MYADQKTLQIMDVGERFGENLLRIRQARKLSQEELADLAGLHRTQVSLIERGHREPRMETVLRLAGALEVPPETLFEGIRWEPATASGKGRFRVVEPPELPRFGRDN